MSEIFDVEMLVTVRVTVNDPLVLRRPVENIDGWREMFYDLQTRDDVLQMLAHNSIANGVQTAQRLDGWADLTEDAAAMDEQYASLWSVSEVPR